MRKRLQTSARPELENALLMCINQVRRRNVPFSGPIITAKAMDFTRQIDIENFAASGGWFWRFKMCHGLTLKNVCGEKADVDQAVCDEWTSGQLREHLAGYALSDISNADGTAPYFKLLPDEMITYKNDTRAGGKTSEERVTVLVCANATGTERCRLLVTGKASEPHCFKGIKDSSCGLHSEQKVLDDNGHLCGLDSHAGPQVLGEEKECPPLRGQLHSPLGG